MDGSSGMQDEGRGLSRRQVMAGLGATAAASGLSALPSDAAASARARVVGAPAVGRTAMEFVGRIGQNGGEFVAYGFFTLLHGLERGLLFTALGDPQSESTARFTFLATASLVQRSVIDGRVFVVDVAGTLDHYFQRTAGATFADPASFARGTRIARSSLRFQNALSTIAPNEGIPSLEGPMVQESDPVRFALGGRSRRFGRKGLRTHVYATGRGTRLEPTAPVVSLSIAGNAIVLG